ncbi:hypothetical protein AB7C87_20655 [Natrarchaeobius sp. A-rgal3]|uniref:hypothetical protein n=1 Tax=Natrarchaeobius versutus TaxID=1679078 RepID=UPI00350F1AC9
MDGPEQKQETDDGTGDERMKVAARCHECNAVYSAWILSDDTVQPIGRKDGCRCGSSEFEAISK